MSRKARRFPRLAIAIVAVGLLAPTSAFGLPSDLRSADAVDAARQAQTQPAQIRPESGPVDLRSPDAVDTRFVQTPEPPTIVESSGGFDWGDAGIGAGATLGLVLIGMSLMFTVVHRRNRTATV